MRPELTARLSCIARAAAAAVLLPFLTVCVAAQQLPRENADEEQRHLRERLEQGASSEWVRQSGEDVEGRAYWFEFQRRFPFDVIPAGAHKRAIEHMNAMRDRMATAAAKTTARLFATNQWSEIGPSNLGGRVRAMAIHPVSSEVVYIGGAAGGVWKTTDGGATWRTTFDKQSALSIGAIAIDPVNPQNVYVGTGELCVGSTIAFMADGVFKSTDGGETWINSGLNSLVAISDIHVHKTNPSIVYVTAGRIGGSSRYSGGGLGASNGFYRSTDAGATWTQISQGQYVDMAVNPLDNDELVITTQRSVSRSRDAGATFFEINSGITNLPNSIRLSLAYDPIDPKNVYVLQAFNGGDVHLGNLFRSSNGGDTWDFVSALDSSIFRTQGQYNHCIAVDPTDPTIVLAGGIDLWRSTNAGQSFENVTRTFGSTRDRDLAHPDHHIIAFDPAIPGLVYVGSDGGVYQSFTSGATFQRLHAELNITQFYAMEVDQSRPYRVYGGTQDNQTHGGFGTDAEHNQEWDRLLGGDGFFVVIDNTDRDIIYAEQPYGQMYRIDLNNLDNNTWIVGGINNDGGYWSTPIAMSPITGALYSGRTRVYRAANPRTSQVAWEELNPGYTVAGSKSVVLALSPFDARMMIVGNESGDIRFSVDDGATWTKSLGLPARFPTDIMYDPTDANRVYATISGFRAGHVFVSDDSGATFRDITSNLPDVPVNAIEIDPTDNSHVFVGTDIGVFATLDAGESWFPFNEGMPVVPVADMRIHRSRRVLIAATHGRSLLEASIDDIAVPPVLIAPVGGESFATPGAITVRWSGFSGPVDVALSLRSGSPFVTAASGIVGDSIDIGVGTVRSSTARVRVTGANAQEAISGSISLTPSVNIETLGRRAFIAEAIARRGNQLWATVRGSDTIRRLNLPALTGFASVRRSGFTGSVRDLAHDAVDDVFYALVADADFANPKVYRLDTMGAMTATIPLPASITAASGIDVVASGLAIATPGAQGRIAVVDRVTGVEIESRPYANARGDWRRGLARVGRTFAQGVVLADPMLDFPSELQLVADDDTSRFFEALPIVLPSGTPLYFFDIASDDTTADAMYYATDTSGSFYRIRNDRFSNVEQLDGSSRSNDASSIYVSPNPMRDRATLRFSVDASDEVSFSVLAATGEVMTSIPFERVEAGAHERTIDVGTLSAGMYFVVTTTRSGTRNVTPIVIVR